MSWLSCQIWTWKVRLAREELDGFVFGILLMVKIQLRSCEGNGKRMKGISGKDVFRNFNIQW